MQPGRRILAAIGVGLIKARAAAGPPAVLAMIGLLELPDQNAVIKVQVPTGLLLLVANIGLLYFLMHR